MSEREEAIHKDTKSRERGRDTKTDRQRVGDTERQRGRGMQAG